MRPDGADSRVGTTVLGNYRLVRKIGEGGMGSVYEAEHVVLGTKLAVKVLHAECAARPEIVRRFQAEAWAASRLQHPNIIRVIDIGQLETGEPYLALEYLEGYGLDALPLPLLPDQVLLVMVPVCQALDAAHRRGIIHRDIKPPNIFIQIQPDARQDTKTVKVLDFGIAKLATESLLAGAERTHVQAVMGTPAYISPEQARSSTAVTAASDIWSLGVMLFELCTGRRPYRATTLTDVVAQQLTSPPPALSAVRPDLPPGWSAIVGACLSIDPAGRPRSALDLAELLVMAAPGGVELARQLGFVPTGRAVLPGHGPETVPMRGGVVTTHAGATGERVAKGAPTVGLGPANRSRRRPWLAAIAVASAIAAVGAGAGMWMRTGGRDGARAAASEGAPTAPAEDAAGPAAPLAADAGTPIATPATATTAAATPVDAAPDAAPANAQPATKTRPKRTRHHHRRDPWKENEVPTGPGDFEVK